MAFINSNNISNFVSRYKIPLDEVYIIVFHDFKDENDFVEIHNEYVYELKISSKINENNIFKRWIIIPKDRFTKVIGSMKNVLEDGTKIEVLSFNTKEFKEAKTIEEFLKYVENDGEKLNSAFETITEVLIDSNEENGIKVEAIYNVKSYPIAFSILTVNS